MSKFIELREHSPSTRRSWRQVVGAIVHAHGDRAASVPCSSREPDDVDIRAPPGRQDPYVDPTSCGRREQVDEVAIGREV